MPNYSVPKVSFTWEVDTLSPALRWFDEAFDKKDPEIAMAMARAGMFISTRAVEILQAKGHVVTGTLWRSIHVDWPGATQGYITAADAQVLFSNYQKNFPSRAETDRAFTGYGFVSVDIGSWIEYAYIIESLGDGGYVFPAFNEMGPKAVNYAAREIMKIIMQGRPTI